MHNALDNARLRLVDLESLQGKLDKFNMKVVGLEAKVDKLKLKVAEAKEVDISKFKESDAYKLVLNTATT